MFYANCRIKSKFAQLNSRQLENTDTATVCACVCLFVCVCVCLASQTFSLSRTIFCLAFFWLLLAGINWFALYINANICLASLSLSLSLSALRWRPPASTGTSLSSHSPPFPYPPLLLYAPLPIGLADCLSSQRYFSVPSVSFHGCGKRVTNTCHYYGKWRCSALLTRLGRPPSAPSLLLLLPLTSLPSLSHSQNCISCERRVASVVFIVTCL